MAIFLKENTQYVWFGACPFTFKCFIKDKCKVKTNDGTEVKANMILNNTISLKICTNTEEKYGIKINKSFVFSRNISTQNTS